MDAVAGPWTLHLLARTGLGILGVAPQIAEAVLNPSATAAHAHLQHQRLLQGKARGPGPLAAHLMRLVDGCASNVVPIRD